MATKSERLRAALDRPELALLPGGFSPLHARMCERLGYDAFFMSGSQVGAYLYAVPDVGLLSMRDMADAVKRLATGADIPIFADADTGYGNAINVRHTVQEYVRAGAAGLHIEDQEFPKRSGTAAGRRCIPVEEAVGKYRAAVDAARELDEDFVICARCDLVGAEGGSFEAAVERCIAYKEQADVDLIWLNTVPTKEEVREALRAIPGPVMVTYGGPAPGVTLEEWQEWGAAAAIFPGMTTGVGLNAVWDFLNDFKARGNAANGAEGARTRNKTWDNMGWQELVGDAAVKDLEARYLPSEQQRDYDHTFGHTTRP